MESSIFNPFLTFKHGQGTQQIPTNPEKSSGSKKLSKCSSYICFCLAN